MIFLSGLPETRCGAGSTFKATTNIRTRLPALLTELGARTLLDAPCGDCNWIAEMDLSGLDEYVGIDWQDEHIESATDRIALAAKPAKSMRVFKRSVFDEWLQFDAVLSRDFLQHWPSIYTEKFRQRFEESGARHLIATTYDCASNEDIAEPGDFRPLNLRLIWPEPIELIPDGADHALGVWTREQLCA